MGAKIECPNPHPKQPNNRAISPLPARHRHPNSPPTSTVTTLPSTSNLPSISFSNRSRAPPDLLEVQVPLPPSPAIGSCKGWRGSSVGRGPEDREV
ncbi:hypothetical protein ACFX2C_036698 [Malus domestica]